MFNKQRFTTIALIIILVGILIFMWDRYFKELIFDDYQMVSVQLDGKSQLIELETTGVNKGVYGISLKISGHTTETIDLLMGIEKDQFIKQVRLQKGNVIFEYNGDWYLDRCYLFVQEKKGQKGKLEVEYKFLYLN
jgi:hypothetical protein